MPAKTIYSQTIADKIIGLISHTNHSLATISAMPGMPGRATIHRWLNQHEDFRHSYVFAKERQLEKLTFEILSIADDKTADLIETPKGPRPNPGNVARSALQVKARMWIFIRLQPKKHGNPLKEAHHKKQLSAIPHPAGIPPNEKTKTHVVLSQIR